MPVTYGNDFSLSPLFAKLGHSLEEIRVRALQNILSKLEHSLVCDADLVQEKHLHIRLLEWFNFATCPMQPQVLGLVLRMAKHASAARIYLNIGAVEFLTQLRTNADQSLHQLIDEILDQLFHLPMIGQHRHANECIYKHPEQDGDALPSQFLEQSDLSLQTTDLAANPPHPGAPQYVSPPETQVGYFSTRPGTQDDMKTSMYTTQAVTIPGM
ncbi:hypothetical protein NP493_76g05054 [Ridgeia piscesae]|uniref:Rotatin N-terminal domain-containing protein n=1 Tax=Ridgeia piscesae TaxID=27915 RepID=A0AAD9P9E6_RIDPI|nr:hypothetical protein NP493_76g05054 [Ridgeia piscesae]